MFPQYEEKELAYKKKEILEEIAEKLSRNTKNLMRKAGLTKQRQTKFVKSHMLTGMITDVYELLNEPIHYWEQEESSLNPPINLNEYTIILEDKREVTTNSTKTNIRGVFIEDQRVKLEIDEYKKVSRNYIENNFDKKRIISIKPTEPKITNMYKQ